MLTNDWSLINTYIVDTQMAISLNFISIFNKLNDETNGDIYVYVYRKNSDDYILVYFMVYVHVYSHN